MTIKPRYQKNIGLLGEVGQEKLKNSHVAIIGAGGLGGVVFEILVRYGVGKITIADFDSFEETNLNRQLLSSVSNLGQNKAITATARAREINPDVEVIAEALRLTDGNAYKLIAGANLVCDCLGNICDRYVLERAAKKCGIPFIHATVAGAEGRIMTIFPEDRGLVAIYGEELAAPSSGEEVLRGTPPSTVWTIASMQAHEAISLLTNIQPTNRNLLLVIDLSSWRIQRLAIS